MRMPTMILLALVLLLTSCRLPSMTPPPAGVATTSAIAALTGRLGSPRQVQADYKEFAKGATVSLIDGETGYTAATTVTDSNGNFVMAFDAGFVPVADRLYILEAVKGIRERGPHTPPSDTYNQAGADAIRLRTFLYYLPAAAGWISPYNADTGPVFLSRESTALSLAIQLKQELFPQARNFVGSLATDTYQEVVGLTRAEFDAIYAVVKTSIDEDRDPIHFLAFDTNTGTFVSMYKGHFVSGLSPETGSVGDEILILGDGFDQPGHMVVQFYNQVTASVIGTPTKSAIRVKVPVGARSGAVTVTLNGLRQLGPEFKVNSFDGHRATLGAFLYVANYDRRMIVKVHPDGTVEDFATVSDGPTQVLAYTDRSNPATPVDKLYVACQLADKVVVVDVATKAVSDFVAVPRPTGMALLGNVLHVASESAGEVRRFNRDKSSAGAAYTGFTNPSALAFGYDFASGANLLYVAERSNPDRVTQLNLATLAKTPWAYRNNPSGLAVDSAGGVYIAAYDDNMVYRVLPNGALTAFARVPSPAGLMLDGDGVMYIASDAQHQIYRVSPLGDLKPYAYGINNPRGLAIDGLGNLYVSLSQSNAVLKLENLGGGRYRTRPFLAGIANPHGITWRNNRLYIAHPDAGVLSSADSGGALRTEASGLIRPGGADVGPDGNLYVGKYGASVSGEQVNGAPWSDYRTSGGVQVVTPAGAISTRIPILMQRDNSITGLDDGTRFALQGSNHGRRALIMYAATDGPDSSYRYRILHDFGATPRFLERNATGNILFVTVAGDAKIHRFTTPGTPGPNSVWTRDTLTGLTSPSALTYDAANDRLYVLDGSSIKRLNSASAATPTVDGAWGPVTATSATDIAYANNASHAQTLFVAMQTLQEVRSFSVAAPPATLTNAHTYVSGLDIDPENVLAHPTNGEIYVRDTLRSRSYTISTSKVVSFQHNYTGHHILNSVGISPDGTSVRADYEYGRLHGKAFLTTLHQTHEVATHGDWVYVGTHFANEYTGVHAFNRVDGSDMFIRGFEVTYTPTTHPRYEYRSQTGAGVLAVNPTTNRLYAGTGHGLIYEVNIDGTANHGKNTLWTTLNLGERLYGMDISSANDHLWVVGDSRSLYSIRLSDKNVSTIWAGLSQPRF
ncbi:Serine/threonine-protein kinase PknD [compost metagenome]